MKFFVSWTNRDPIFQDYDPKARVLVSPHHVKQNWSVSNWSKMPYELFIDSGAYSTTKNNLTCEDILKRQIFIARNWEFNDNLYVSHPDILIPTGCSHFEMNHIILESLERAKIYMELLKKLKFRCNPIGVIHGFDEESLILSYFELKVAGYKHFAIGSLAVRLSHSKGICMKAIKTLSEYCVNPLHLFGVLWPMHASSSPSNISSFDSSAPSKLGFYGTVLYGRNLKRYVIAPTSKQKFRDQLWTFRSSIDKPLPCVCPICRSNANKLISTNNAKAKFNRTIHNYYQIKWATEQLN